jgi:hypothetical protein
MQSAISRAGLFAMRGAWASSILMLVAGCGGGGGLVPVEGTVTLDGKPLPDATVTLSQVKVTDPGPFVGVTDADGRFALAAVGKQGSGAVPGEYFLFIRTVATPPGADEFTPPPQQREVVPPNYRSGTIRFQVPEGGSTTADFPMTSR